MAPSLASRRHQRLEGSCGDWVRSSGPYDGLELLEAHFAGRGFAPHRHDTYGIGVTDLGVQTFDYRGRIERSLPGQVTILHPDELHDGRAGTEDGFGYRIVYVAPAQIGAALQAITGKPTPLPFVREPVALNSVLAAIVIGAFDSTLEPLARDSLVEQLAEELLAADASLARAARTPRTVDFNAVARARQVLDELRGASVHSAELERETGLSRFELARHFRAAYGTSPYRYALLRRLDVAREALRRRSPLVDVALAAGFADQPHFTRVFRATYGMTPGRYARLHVVSEPFSETMIREAEPGTGAI